MQHERYLRVLRGLRERQPGKRAQQGGVRLPVRYVQHAKVRGGQSSHARLACVCGQLEGLSVVACGFGSNAGRFGGDA